MRKITLYSPAVDRNSNYHDAGEVLTVGAESNKQADLLTETADDLIASGRAVTMTDAASADPKTPAPPIKA
jgi:hypothetical protein